MVDSGLLRFFFSGFVDEAAACFFLGGDFEFSAGFEGKQEPKYFATKNTIHTYLGHPERFPSGPQGLLPYVRCDGVECCRCAERPMTTAGVLLVLELPGASRGGSPSSSSFDVSTIVSWSAKGLKAFKTHVGDKQITILTWIGGEGSACSAYSP